MKMKTKTDKTLKIVSKELACCSESRLLKIFYFSSVSKKTFSSGSFFTLETDLFSFQKFPKDSVFFDSLSNFWTDSTKVEVKWKFFS